MVGEFAGEIILVFRYLYDTIGDTVRYVCTCLSLSLLFLINSFLLFGVTYPCVLDILVHVLVSARAFTYEVLTTVLQLILVAMEFTVSFIKFCRYFSVSICFNNLEFNTSSVISPLKSFLKLQLIQHGTVSMIPNREPLRVACYQRWYVH